MPLFRSSFERIPFTQRNEILSRNTRDNRLSYGENPKSLYHLVLDWYQLVTDRQTDRRTDRITLANIRAIAMVALARKNVVLHQQIF